MLAFLRETRVVEDDDLKPWHLALNQLDESRAHDVVIPTRYDDSLLQPLAHRLDLRIRIDEARRQWLNALSLTIQQQAGHVQAQRLASLRSSETRRELTDKFFELALKLLQLLRLHAVR